MVLCLWLIIYLCFSKISLVFITGTLLLLEQMGGIPSWASWRLTKIICDVASGWDDKHLLTEFIKYLLLARHHSKSWEYCSEQKQKTCPDAAYILVARRQRIKINKWKCSDRWQWEPWRIAGKVGRSVASEAAHGEAKKSLPEMVVMNKPCHAASWDQIVPVEGRTRAKALRFRYAWSMGRAAWRWTWLR